MSNINTIRRPMTSDAAARDLVSAFKTVALLNKVKIDPKSIRKTREDTRSFVEFDIPGDFDEAYCRLLLIAESVSANSDSYRATKSK